MPEQFAEFNRAPTGTPMAAVPPDEAARRRYCASLITSGVPFVLIWQDTQAHGTLYTLEGIPRETVIGACRTLAAACQAEMVETLRRMFQAR